MRQRYRLWLEDYKPPCQVGGCPEPATKVLMISDPDYPLGEYCERHGEEALGDLESDYRDRGMLTPPTEASG